MDQDGLRRVLVSEKEKREQTWRKISENSGVAYSTITNFVMHTRNTSLDVAIRLLDAVGLELCVRRKKHE